MKKLLIIITLLYACAGFAQNTVLSIGTAGYVTVNGQNYPRGYLLSQYAYSGGDTLLGIAIAGPTPRPMIYPARHQAFLNGNNGNAPFTSMAALITWMNANFEEAGGGGVAIPNYQIPFGNGSGITSSSNFSYNGNDSFVLIANDGTNLLTTDVNDDVIVGTGTDGEYIQPSYGTNLYAGGEIASFLDASKEVKLGDVSGDYNNLTLDINPGLNSVQILCSVGNMFNAEANNQSVFIGDLSASGDGLDLEVSNLDGYVAIGDYNDNYTGTTVVADAANRIAQMGDIHADENGIIIEADDQNNTVAFGDLFGVTNGNALQLNNNNQKLQFKSQDATATMMLDNSNGGVYLGDISENFNSTQLTIDDVDQLISMGDINDASSGQQITIDALNNITSIGDLSSGTSANEIEVNSGRHQIIIGNPGEAAGATNVIVDNSNRVVELTGGLQLSSMGVYSSGSTFAVLSYQRGVYVDPTSVVSSLVLTLPASNIVRDGQEFIFDFGGTIVSGNVVTSLNFSVTSGSILATPTLPFSNVTAGKRITAKYRQSNNTWYIY